MKSLHQQCLETLDELVQYNPERYTKLRDYLKDDIDNFTAMMVYVSFISSEFPNVLEMIEKQAGALTIIKQSAQLICIIALGIMAEACILLIF